MLISLIAAMTPEHVIGRKGQLPWHVPEDLKHFKVLTTGHTVLMGRKTFESIAKPLPNRTNLILSRKVPTILPAGTQWYTELRDAVAAAQKSGERELFVVGGAEIYTLAMPLANRMYISIIKMNPVPDGDAWFPQWQVDQWRLQESRVLPDVEFLTYYRR